MRPEGTLCCLIAFLAIPCVACASAASPQPPAAASVAKQASDASAARLRAIETREDAAAERFDRIHAALERPARRDLLLEQAQGTLDAALPVDAGVADAAASDPTIQAILQLLASDAGIEPEQKPVQTATPRAEGPPAADIANQARALAEAKGVAASTNRFGFALYQQVRARGGSLAISPVLTELVLAMTSARTWRGGEFVRLERTLRDSKIALFGALHCAPTDTGRVLLDPDGKVFVPPANGSPSPPPRVAFDQMYTSRLNGDGIWGAIAANVEGSAEAMRESFRQWSVHDPEADRFRPGAVPFNVAMMLDGWWNLPFDGRRERTEAFNAATPAEPQDVRDQIRAYLVTGHASMAYAHTDGAQLVDLPLGRGFSMLLVLPDTLEALGAVERRLPDRYDRWIAALKVTPVNLTLPQWNTGWIRTPGDLSGPLSAMGLLPPQEPRPAGRLQQCAETYVELDGLSNLPIGDVEQIQAGRRTVEQPPPAGDPDAGVATATATPPASTHTVVADHTFLYVIRHTQTGLVVLIGRMAHPVE